jgi:lipoprotein signal peptidase
VGLPAVVAAVGVVTIDQATKALAHHRALPNPQILLGIVPTGSVTTTIAATTGLLAVAIWVLARQVAAGRCPGWLAGIPLAAAASNVIDRLSHGAVTDWITIGDYLFNLADIAIVVGAAAVALTVRHHHAAGRREPARPEAVVTTT